MKELLIEALNGAYLKMKICPTKTVLKSRYIGDEPTESELEAFSKELGVPQSELSYGCLDDECDDDENNDVYLQWKVEVNKTEKELRAEARKRFERFAWYAIFKILSKDGYLRSPFNQGADYIEGFNDTTIYDLYINKDFDTLVAYYSLGFRKPKGMFAKHTLTYSWAREDNGDWGEAGEKASDTLKSEAVSFIENRIGKGESKGALPRITIPYNTKEVAYIGVWSSSQTVSITTNPKNRK